MASVLTGGIFAVMERDLGKVEPASFAAMPAVKKGERVLATLSPRVRKLLAYSALLHWYYAAKKAKLASVSLEWWYNTQLHELLDEMLPKMIRAEVHFALRKHWKHLRDVAVPENAGYPLKLEIRKGGKIVGVKKRMKPGDASFYYYNPLDYFVSALMHHLKGPRGEESLGKIK